MCAQREILIGGIPIGGFAIDRVVDLHGADGDTAPTADATATLNDRRAVLHYR